MKIPEEQSFIRQSLIGIALASSIFLMLILSVLLHHWSPSIGDRSMVLLTVGGPLSFAGMLWVVIQTVRGIRLFFFNNHHGRGFCAVLAIDILLSILICLSLANSIHHGYDIFNTTIQETTRETKD